ncbi:hypothetical protein AYL99_09526 [Fonsecaea erecta]|uniref:FAD/NAD(P)-binding domain-containing protein n=1 Tax=Fonsecaea erecta TaxID=1367422 RepID=A0A178Z975_9EURO|nr:hypothetical protein AYL99_09526 [Fonsecaea erecta]OAP56347.1 hypothetical protein AYL99_09526 [Fonsecaea erecta]
MGPPPVQSVAIIGAGAAGAAAAAAFAAEKFFTRIRVFERREAPGGTWIYDPDPGPGFKLFPGGLPPSTDPPLKIPDTLPRLTSPISQERYDKTPIYDSLTTNVPDIAMSFSDDRFPYGPFPPHWVPRQYIANYFSLHRTDTFLVLNTTVEDLSRLPGKDGWKLTLRRRDSVRHVDVWWEEEFDAVILANGHYSVPFVPEVDGLDRFIRLFPQRVMHSKSYRNTLAYHGKRVLVIGNSASGHDVTAALVESARLPVYQSRRSSSRWDGDKPPSGIAWKPIVKQYLPTGDIVFADGSVLSDIDVVIYCTGYKASFPFWNVRANGGPLWDYTENRLVGSYWHTYHRDFPTLGIVGVPRVLTFRSFEYQAIALARLFAGRNALPLPPREAQERWERDRWRLVSREGRKFHDIPWDNGETMDWLRGLFDLAGLPLLKGRGRYPPVLGDETRWAIEHLRKYSEPGNEGQVDEEGWTVLGGGASRDSLHFI